MSATVGVALALVNATSEFLSNGASDEYGLDRRLLRTEERWLGAYENHW